MRKCKQVISLILVLTMMFAILSVGIVQGDAADTNEIYQVPPSEPVLLGDVDRNGRVNGFDVIALKNSIAHNFAAGYLDYTKMAKNSIDFKVANCNKNDDGTAERIDGFDVFLLQQYIAHIPEARDKGIGEPIYPDPTEPPTQAPTDEETKATVTIYGLNGQSETREFYIGDTFEVYTSMNVKKNGEDVQIASASGDQTFTDPALSLESEIDSEQLFTDIDTVFPVFGDQAMGRFRGTGWVQYNASTPSMTNAFVFDSDDDLVIVTKYTVMRGGNIEVRNALSYLAAADENITKLVTKGEVAPDVELTVNATFEKPEAPVEPTEAPTEAPKPTEAPTEEPKPTEAPTEAPKPTEAPTEAPKPTVAPTEAPKPTEAPTEAPKPTAAPTEAPKPTEAPTEAPKPTEAPTEAPTQPQGKATVTVHGLDGKTETQEFNVGDTFTVYTTLNTSAYNNGKIGSINGRQLYTNAVLRLTDEYTEQDGILDLESMFPVTQYATMASGHHTDLADDDEYHDATRGGIFYNASIASYRGFAFDNNGAILIKSNYEVTAPGNADITNEMITLAYADEDLTRIIDRGVIVRDDFRLHASFLAPELQPTEAPTEAPKPTEAPTEAPEPTEAPTEPAPEDTYIVAGNATVIFGTSWNKDDISNTMEYANDVWYKEYTVSAAMKDVQLKAVKNGTTWIGDETGNNVTFNLDGAGTFTVYCDGTKTWVDGDIVSYESGLDVQSVTAVGNGTTDGDNWLNNISWDPAAAANHMTKVSDGIYEIEYTLGEYDTSDPEFKFAINDAWTHNFGLGDNGVIANGVTTDAIYNGSTNLKITGLTAGTTIKMQLDLTGFDFDTKTGAKMTITWTAPAEPTEAPTEAPKPTEAPTEAPKPTAAPTEAPKPTEAPTEAPKPTEAPTEAPTQPQGKATVTVHGLDGKTETQEFNVGDTFTVYTTLNTSAYNNGKIGSINGRQLYTNAVLKLTDEYTEQDGILDLESMFPITQYATMASGHHTDLADDDEYHDATRGGIFYNASIASYRGFAFDNNGAILIKSNYEVTAPGNADITNEMVTLAYADEDLTRIIDRGVIVRNDFRLHASFLAPELQPTEAPTEAPKPTEAPTEAPKPTEAPTEAPKPTEAPTEAPKPTEAPTEAPKPTEAPTEAPDVTNRTIIFSNNKGFSTVNIYYWSEEDQPVDWPGVPMTYYDTNEMGEQRYSFELPAGMTEYIINDGGTQQTIDITFNGATGVYMTDKDSSGNYEVAFYDIGGDTDPTTAPTTAPEPTTPTPSVADGYYLVGTMTDWSADSAYKFSENTSNPGEYMLSTTLTATDGVKAVKVENGAITTWYPDGMDNEYIVDSAHAGDVTIYFNPSGSADWSAFGGYIYIDGGSTPTPDPTTAPTEAPTEAPDVTDRTIIFSNNKGFSTVNIYYWSDEDQPVDWPGVPMTYYDTNEMGEQRYSFELPAGMTEYIINDGGTQQTVDITFTGATGVYMTDKDSSGNYQVAFYDIGGEVDPTPDPTTAPQPTQAPEPAKDYVYLNAGGSNLWDQAGARFELYVWNDDGEQWITGTQTDGKYQFEVPAGYTDGIFVRMDPAKAADDWDSVWNQTGDLTLQIGKTYTITSWTGGDNGNSGGSWS